MAAAVGTTGRSREEHTMGGAPDDAERAKLKAEKARKKAARKAERDARAKAGNPRTAGADAGDADAPASKRQKTSDGAAERSGMPARALMKRAEELAIDEDKLEAADSAPDRKAAFIALILQHQKASEDTSLRPVSELELPDKRRLSVDTGEPGATPKVVHTPLVEATTPLGEREAAAEREKAAKAADEAARLKKLAAHCEEVASLAEEQGGFVASKGGMALVGMVARVISQTPAIGAKNLYKQVCEALGNQPNRGKAPNSREVRKIVSALKEDKGLEMVMSSVTPFTSATQRAKLIAKKIEEGPKSEDGAKKLFMGAPSTLLHEPSRPLSVHVVLPTLTVVVVCVAPQAT